MAAALLRLGGLVDGEALDQPFEAECLIGTRLLRAHRPDQTGVFSDRRHRGEADAVETAGSLPGGERAAHLGKLGAVAAERAEHAGGLVAVARGGEAGGDVAGMERALARLHPGGRLVEQLHVDAGDAVIAHRRAIEAGAAVDRLLDVVAGDHHQRVAQAVGTVAGPPDVGHGALRAHGGEQRADLVDRAGAERLLEHAVQAGRAAPRAALAQGLADVLVEVDIDRPPQLVRLVMAERIALLQDVEEALGAQGGEVLVEQLAPLRGLEHVVDGEPRLERGDLGGVFADLGLSAPFHVHLGRRGLRGRHATAVVMVVLVLVRRRRGGWGSLGREGGRGDEREGEEGCEGPHGEISSTGGARARDRFQAAARPRKP